MPSANQANRANQKLTVQLFYHFKLNHNQPNKKRSKKPTPLPKSFPRQTEIKLSFRCISSEVHRPPPDYSLAKKM